MTTRAHVVRVIASMLLSVPSAEAGMTFLSQERSIAVATSFDGGSQTAAAPDFGLFVQTLDLAVTFPALGGGTGVNRAFAGIDCQLDPNRIRLNGTLGGAGGAALLDGGGTQIEFGEARVLVNLSFHLDSLTNLSLVALRRPSTDPNDRFKIKLKAASGGDVIFLLDESSPPQPVDFSTTLSAGDYDFEYEAQFTVAGEEILSAYGLQIDVPAPGGGVLGLLGVIAGLRRRR